MATCNSSYDPEDKRKERRKQVMLGELPTDFLRVTPITTEQQLALDEQAALALQQQLSGTSVASTVAGRLTISIIEAKLNKNYGLTRMDPYVRLTVGQTVYETHTDYNGAKNPRWNRNFNCFLFTQDKHILLEIFDECSFSLDDKIAWAKYVIPENVLQGETANEWIELSGKLGEGKEGVINIVITCQPIPSGTVIYHSQPFLTVMPYRNNYGRENSCFPEYTTAKGQIPDIVASNPNLPPIASETDIKQIQEMFPDVEEEIVRTIIENHQGDRALTINTLLALSEET